MEGMINKCLLDNNKIKNHWGCQKIPFWLVRKPKINNEGKKNSYRVK